jgi:hypothetical protein
MCLLCYLEAGNGLRRRARYIALSYGLAILANAIDTKTVALERDAASSLERALQR